MEFLNKFVFSPLLGFVLLGDAQSRIHEFAIAFNQGSPYDAKVGVPAQGGCILLSTLELPPKIVKAPGSGRLRLVQCRKVGVKFREQNRDVREKEKMRFIRDDFLQFNLGNQGRHTFDAIPAATFFEGSLHPRPLHEAAGEFGTPGAGKGHVGQLR